MTLCSLPNCERPATVAISDVWYCERHGQRELCALFMIPSARPAGGADATPEAK